MQTLETWIVALNRALVALALATVFAIVFANVVGRYGFSTSLAWVEEVARHLMILGVDGTGWLLPALYLLGADELKGSEIGSDAFVVYQGHHGDTGAYYADVVLPGAA